MSKIREGVEVVKALVETISESDHAIAAGNELGKSAITLTTAINNVLLPLAAINFAFEKARVYFSRAFNDDLNKVAGEIPANKIISPDPVIVGPALQGLAFAHENINLKSMYLNLIKSAMHRDKNNLAHPAFVEILKQLSAQDAILYRTFGRAPYERPIVEIRKAIESDFTYTTLQKHVLFVALKKTKRQVFIPNLDFTIDNWTRLGLMLVDYNAKLSANGSYNWILRHPRYNRILRENAGEEHRIFIQEGVMEVTALGKQFSHAVGITSPIENVVGGQESR